MKCDWESDDESCSNEAVEKWTNIPYICPYSGPFYANAEDEATRSPPVIVKYRCEEHCHLYQTRLLQICKGDVTKAKEVLDKLYQIEKL